MTELEAGLISKRTKAALAATKAWGIRLGNPRLQLGITEIAKIPTAAHVAQARARAADLAPVIAEIKATGIGTFAGISCALAPWGSRRFLAGPNGTR